ncbi:anthocyanidin 5,3-O-glucosyltransferase-like [Hordeum vulgare subsp. vulgare]|uniref:anthocyanidin 5,3-O-glucosyltransferase-like n=1 Tax=Hordeum vulgare subsp. vulgare TaxID=112509 RepID=UPI001D1A565A|nr:anthocyanidin 5,3-O-glucosyltransferase-like [Hordeum vulgare subsp. vulgare]
MSVCIFSLVQSELHSNSSRVDIHFVLKLDVAQLVSALVCNRKVLGPVPTGALPRVTLPSDVRARSDQDKILGRACASIPNLREFLRSTTPALAALVIDSFCSGALDVGAELGIPTYFFLTTCTACLAFSLHKPAIDEQQQIALSFRDLAGVFVRAPGVPPIPVDHLPAFLLDRGSLSSRFFLELPERLCNSQGLIVNSCRYLEPRATDAIVSGLCTYRGRQTPPLYCIGPLIRPEEAGTKRHECLAWLDGQPKASVVFLSFGSLGRFSAEQIKQMAAGLETSGQRFLWVVRRPTTGDEHQPADDLDALFPEGFLYRTKERGLVVMSWAPQREVLAHGAVGGFVTHCGWNSVLEAVMAGVPMLAWPLYAEQRMNKVFLVEEMQLAVAMEGYVKEMVEAREVAAKVRWLVDSDGGRELRQRTLAAMRQAKEALDDGGESRTALLHLVRVQKRRRQLVEIMESSTEEAAFKCYFHLISEHVLTSEMLETAYRYRVCVSAYWNHSSFIVHVF